MTEGLEEALDQAFEDLGPNPEEGAEEDDEQAGVEELEENEVTDDGSDEDAEEEDGDDLEEDLEDEELDDEEDEEDDDGEGDEESEESEDDDGDPLELDDEDVLIVDGEEVTFQEIREGNLREADYTKKTQELADERREVEEAAEKLQTWVDERQQDPVAWVAEIAAGSGNPSWLLGKAIEKMASQGQLDPRFVKAAGLDEEGEARQVVDEGEQEQRLRTVEERQEAERREREEAKAREAAKQQYLNQFEAAVEKAGVTFSDRNQRDETIAEVAEYASANGINHLGAAFHQWTVENGPVGGKKTEPKPKKRKKKKASKKKKQSGAMSRSSSTKKPKRKKSADSIEEAFENAYSETPKT